MMKKPTQKELILSYYRKRPGEDVYHEDAVDWATAEWKKQNGTVFRDPDRAVRLLYQEGRLTKVSKGVYRYESDARPKRLEDFTSAQKAAIFRRDDYRCVICGRGKKDGVEIHADHIKPKERGGEAKIENGQTLCAEHNFRKKTYKQTETGKRMFIRLHELAEKSGDKKLVDFCRGVLEVYDFHEINGHIQWKKGE